MRSAIQCGRAADLLDRQHRRRILDGMNEAHSDPSTGRCLTMDGALIAEVEAAGYRCWAAREVEEYDGWQLRCADGFSRRANSVLPVGASTLDLDTKLRHCGEWFERRGLQLVIRCTPVCEEGIDGELRSRGFTLEGATHVMVTELDGATTSEGSIPAEAPDDRWWRAMPALWDIPVENQPGWRAIIERIVRPAAYVLTTDGVDDVAAGLAVADGAWLGLFELVVGPEWRHRGHGREITRSLLAWGMSHGARCAFLQVVASNRPAITLYESLGFQHAYDYWYLRAPVG
jgi:ribosomal protein S18 acetylase RimI-like enzyme